MRINFVTLISYKDIFRQFSLILLLLNLKFCTFMKTWLKEKNCKSLSMLISNLIIGFNKYGVYSLFPGGPSLGSAIYSHSSTIAGRFTSGSLQPQTGGPFHTAHKSKYTTSHCSLLRNTLRANKYRQNLFVNNKYS